KHIWTQRFGGPGEDVGNAVFVDDKGNVLVAGLFTGEVMIGQTRLVGAGSDDAFVAKLAPDGTPIWARQLGGRDSDAAHDVVASPGGEAIWVTGSFKDQVQAADVVLK